MKWILSAGFLCLNAAAAGLPESAQAVQEAHQAILVEGWNTSPAEAAQLESQLASLPQDVAARTRLISYYYQQMIAEPRTRHILWLIENHPEANVFRVAPDVTSLEVTWHGMNSFADRDKARALWLRQLEQFSSDTAVLTNVAQALPEESFRVVRRLRMLEPSNPVWTVNLADVYARAVRNVFYVSSPMQGWAFAGPARYRNMWQMHLPIALPAELAENLKSELETSSDTALVGVTGELLVEQLVVLRGRGGETPELTKSAAFGQQLVERAQLLDPNNPEWRH